jgi:hypothetical protein
MLTVKNISRMEGRVIMEKDRGVNSIIVHLLYCKNFSGWYNVPPSQHNIKKKKREKVQTGNFSKDTGHQCLYCVWSIVTDSSIASLKSTIKEYK